MGQNAENSYRERYAGLARALGRTLTELEHNTEALMLNAAQVVALEDSQNGLLPTEKLKAIRDRISVTHIFVTDAHGKFIRSTNENPALIPNLFSFCGRYKELIDGGEIALGTPIIPPDPEPKPFKFLTVPSVDRTRLIEVGVRVDFIGKTLSSAVKDDANVLALKIYAPDGTTLGSFSREGVDYTRRKVKLPEAFGAVVSDAENIRIFEKVESTQPHCCQCDVSGISKNGNYYYVIESVVSKSALAATQASFRRLFLVLEIISILIAFFAAKAISVRLVARVRLVKDRVRAIEGASDLGARIGLSGNDEISFLAKQFDHLLERLERSQQDLLASQKKAAFGEFAGQIAHNIGSPVRALEMTLPVLKLVPDQHRRIIRNAVKEIHDLVLKLRAQSERRTRALDAPNHRIEVDNKDSGTVELLSDLLDAAVSEVRVQFKTRRGIEIGVDLDERSYGLFARVETTEFKVIVANLIKNSVEAMDEWDGAVVVSLRQENGRAVIEVVDDGKGISPEILAQLGKRGATFGKADGSGIGIHHAKSTVERWGGELVIRSVPGRGTTVHVEIPLIDTPEWFVPVVNVTVGGHLIVLDDDVLSRQIWRSRLTEAKIDVNLCAFREGRELREWVAENRALAGAVFLVDFELAASGEDGLRIIESLGIAESSILVTGHSGEPSVMARAQWLGVRVLPKCLVPWVPIHSVSGCAEEVVRDKSAKNCTALVN